MLPEKLALMQASLINIKHVNFVIYLWQFSFMYPEDVGGQKKSDFNLKYKCSVEHGTCNGEKIKFGYIPIIMSRHHSLKYSCNTFNLFCKLSLESANRTRSSAYSKQGISLFSKINELIFCRRILGKSLIQYLTG